jgi:predicted RNase H-related nuclease YkuK (DUF458 family)
MSLGQTIEQIQTFIEEEPKAQYKVIIGSDSQTNSLSTIFVTALIIQRIGKGSCFYYRKKKVKPMKDLTHRIYKETQSSIELIDELNNSGLTEMLSKWPMEIHIDIGKQGETRKLIQEVVGWVTSIGYIAKIKPYSFGASSVADKYTG